MSAAAQVVLIVTAAVFVIRLVAALYQVPVESWIVACRARQERHR